MRVDPGFGRLSALGALGAALLVSGCATAPTSRPAAVARNATLVCAEARYPIYFQPSSDQLTRESAQVIGAAAQQVRGCTLGALEVVGLAGSLDGPREQSMELARRRSVVVANALKMAGLPAPSFDLDAVGAASAPAKSGRREPLRRRAEVVIRASAPVTAR